MGKNNTLTKHFSFTQTSIAIILACSFVTLMIVSSNKFINTSVLGVSQTTRVVNCNYIVTVPNNSPQSVTPVCNGSTCKYVIPVSSGFSTRPIFPTCTVISIGTSKPYYPTPTKVGSSTPYYPTPTKVGSSIPYVPTPTKIGSSNTYPQPTSIGISGNR